MSKGPFRNSKLFANENSGNRSAALADTGFEEIQFNLGKIQKIIENLIYWKITFETKIGQIQEVKRKIRSKN